ncbi:MAG: LysM peptidoglycan-binding domain-containing protein [Anaerolineae bacterium]|jgi:LysM repeat protein|nr:LysM peptidoglycan-binding domain-containing protein [Anaerolineae bacterium]
MMRTRSWRIIGVLMLAFLISGCWLSGYGEFDRPVSQNLPTETATPTETVTLTPSPFPSETFTPTEDPTVSGELDADFAAQTAEETEESAFAETEEVTPEEVNGLIFPTETATPTETEAPAIAQFETLDPREEQATALVGTSTQEILDLTATAEAILLITLQADPTETETPFSVTLAPSPSLTPGVGGGPVLSGNDCVHEVRAGENLFRLSLLYGVGIRDIALASGVANPELILVGQRLTIPGCGTTGVRPPATTIPTQVAAGSPGTGGTGTGGSAGGITHVVEQGETLFQISLRYNVPIRDIAAANNITNVNLIYFNQTLIIP